MEALSHDAVFHLINKSLTLFPRLLFLVNGGALPYHAFRKVVRFFLLDTYGLDIEVVD